MRCIVSVVMETSECTGVLLCFPSYGNLGMYRCAAVFPSLPKPRSVPVCCSVSVITETLECTGVRQCFRSNGNIRAYRRAAVVTQWQKVPKAAQRNYSSCPIY